uniref:Ig-like domain-containing protein n=1 Tax=Equus caballus TaxID=9796 RepID=F6U9F1_HORSE
MADIGSYRAMIATETSSVFSSYTLRIFKRLPRPYIRVDSVISENGMCHATLRCSVEEGGENVTYEWTSMGQGAVVSKKGSILNDSWSLGDLDWTYTCTAMNTVSNSISNLIHAGQLCAVSKAATGTYCPVTWILLVKKLNVRGSKSLAPAHTTVNDEVRKVVTELTSVLCGTLPQHGLRSGARSARGIQTCEPWATEAERGNLTTTPSGWSQNSFYFAKLKLCTN